MTDAIATTEESKPKPTSKPERKAPKRKAPKRKAASSARAKGKRASRAKSSGGSMAKQGRYVLVINMSRDLQRKIDAARKKSGESRSGFCRSIVEKKLG